MPGIPAILGIVFIILKLCGVVAWSWLWVLAPFWIPLGLGIVALIFAAPFVIAKVRKASRSLPKFSGWLN